MPRAVQVLRRSARATLRQGRADTPAGVRAWLTLTVALLIVSLAWHDARAGGDDYAPLPKPPDGWTLREVARLPQSPTRVASDGAGTVLYVLCNNGDVWRLNLGDGSLKQIPTGEKYVSGEVSAFGMTIDNSGRLYVITNVRDGSVKPNLNHVTIFRSSQRHDAPQINLRPWLKTTYPYGVNNFNHGVGHIAQGPDGFLYVTSGSRTDANEASADPNFSSEGETPLTACLWRLDPRSNNPQIEVYAHGLRNPYGFCWDDKGRMIATENGPNLDPPEELNEIRRGRHYGFPYQFSDWHHNPYAHIGPAPAGLEMTKPIVNVGPDGGFQSNGKPIATFDAHSSPSGIVYLGDQFPAAYRGTFLVPRFGNMLRKPADVGFDVLQVRLRDSGGDSGGEPLEAEVKTFLKPVARPVDIHLCGGKVYLCEYTRELTLNGPGSDKPGRILELSVAAPPASRPAAAR